MVCFPTFKPILMPFIHPTFSVLKLGLLKFDLVRFPDNQTLRYTCKLKKFVSS